MAEDKKPVREVVDQEAYDAYLEIANSDLMSKDNRFITLDVDPHLKIDQYWVTRHFQKMTSHLLEEDLVTVKATMSSIKSARGRMQHLRNKAYGMKKNGPQNTQSLLAPKKAELIELFGKFHTVAEVLKIVNVNWGFQVSIDAVGSFRKKYWDKIKERQEFHKRDHSDIRLGHMKSRLIEYSELYKSLKAQWEISKSKDDYKLLLQTLDQFRKEVDGDKLVIDGHLQIDVEHSINLHLASLLTDSIPVMNIIISKVAARMKVNPIFLLTRLHNSIYAKHSGFAAQGAGFDENDIKYPSSIVYNTEHIRKMYQTRKEIDGELAQYQDLSDQSKKKAVTLKERLAMMLAEKQSDLDESVDRIDTAGD